MSEENLLLLCSLFKVQSNYRNDEFMIEFIEKELQQINLSYSEDSYGNIYVTKGNANIYPCFVCHIDTVHPIFGGRVMTILREGKLFTKGIWDFGEGNYSLNPIGCGADDKVGIFCCIRGLKELDNLKVVFFKDEEIGCRGSKQADMDFFKDCSFVFQSDRKNSNDFITYSNGVEINDNVFRNEIKKYLKKYNYKCQKGIATDVGQLKINGLEIAAANISSGYYNAHSRDEYVILTEVENCFAFMKDVAINCSDKQHIHILKEEY